MGPFILFNLTQKARTDRGTMSGLLIGYALFYLSGALYVAWLLVRAFYEWLDDPRLFWCLIGIVALVVYGNVKGIQHTLRRRTRTP